MITDYFTRKLSTNPESLKQKTVLITGGTGFIGSAMVRYLQQYCDNVHAIVRSYKNIERLENCDNVRIHQIHLEETGALSELADIKPNYIFHLAQPPYAEQKDIRGFLTSQSHGLGMLTNVLEFARSADVEKVIHGCSSLLYKAGPKVFNESSTLQPITLRGISKFSERAICQYYSSLYGLPITLGRIFRAYGPWDLHTKLIVRALDCSMQNLPLPLTQKPHGRDYIYVDDVCRALTELCLTQTKLFDEFNIGTGRETNAEELIAVLNQEIGQSIQISSEFYPSTDMDKDYWCADISKITQNTEWRPTTSLVDGLKLTVRWYFEHQKHKTYG